MDYCCFTKILHFIACTCPPCSSDSDLVYKEYISIHGVCGGNYARQHGRYKQCAQRRTPRNMESKCTNIRYMFIFACSLFIFACILFIFACIFISGRLHIFACSFVGTIFAIAEALQWLQYCGHAFTKIYIVVAMSVSRSMQVFFYGSRERFNHFL